MAVGAVCACEIGVETATGTPPCGAGTGVDDWTPGAAAIGGADKAAAAGAEIGRAHV
jgi:hypothetical protein